MISIQLDLFDGPHSEEELLRLEIKAIVESQDRLRKGLFARHAELVKLVMIQQKEIDLLKQALKNK
jgi:hypothetical protein